MKQSTKSHHNNLHFKEYNYDYIATELINQAKSPYSVPSIEFSMNRTKSVPMELMRPKRRNSQLSDEYTNADDDQPFKRTSEKSVAHA